MGYFENLIQQRIYFFISEIEVTLDDYLENPLLATIDVEQCTLDKELFFSAHLSNGSTLIVKEEYQFEHHRLKIQYNYTLLSNDGKPIVSFDNRPHHPTLSTFPNHKHFYPKHRYEPITFNGDFVEALQEILWIIENKNN